MHTPPFAVLYDYRCPFARNAHEHLMAAIEGGLELDVSFEPFTLDQGHVDPGEPPVWEDPTYASRLLALEVSVAVRDGFPEQFLDLHAELFHARHVEGIELSTHEQLSLPLERVGLDAAQVFSFVEGGQPRQIIADRWTHFHDDLEVFGVPTFVFDDADATFVRLMHGPDADEPGRSVELIDQLLRLMVLKPEINELKHTRLAR
jgi:hypothetical protein